MNKHDFIESYRYMFGTTKKAAEKAYKTASPAYIAAVIDGIRKDAKNTFYEANKEDKKA